MHIDFSFILELVSKVNTYLYDDKLSPRANFVCQFESILEEYPNLRLEDLFQSIDRRVYSLHELLDFQSNTSSLAEKLANKFESYGFRRSLPNLLKVYYGTRIHYLLHVPKTGGQSFTNNLIDNNFVVWDMNPDSHTDYVYYELPTIVNKLKANNLLVSHSHIFYSHLQSSLDLRQGDSIICLLRDPVSLHISNINYIYENIKSSNYGKVIDERWHDFLPYIANPSKMESLIRIATSEQYCNIYGDIYSKYLFGEIDIGSYELESLISIAGRMINFIDISRVDSLLINDYGIALPKKYNVSVGDQFDKDHLINVINWDRLVNYDKKIYSMLCGDQRKKDGA